MMAVPRASFAFAGIPLLLAVPRETRTLSCKAANSAQPTAATPTVADLSPSALDSLPEPLKLNAVAESLARSRDVSAALDVAAELERCGAALEPRARAAIVDAIASSPGPSAAHRIAQLFAKSPPRGFGKIDVTPVRAKHPVGGEQDSGGEVLPDDGRRVDMTLAASFLAVVGSAVSAEVIEPLFLHHAATEATTVLLLVMGGLAFDRFAAAGVWWNRLTAGMERLLSEDPAREASVEAAFFLVAYLLGLPCAPFRPNVPQLLKLHAGPAKPQTMTTQLEAKRRKQRKHKRLNGQERSPSPANHPTEPRDNVTLTSEKLANPTLQLPPLDDNAVDRYLVWLMAGVAAEAMMDGLLVESDAARARALLRAVGGSGTDARLSTAYATARKLLTRYQVLHTKLAQSMLEGLSAGECINLVDRELAYQT